MLWSSLLQVSKTTEEIEEYNVPKAVPHKSNITVDSRRLFPIASKVTTPPAANAPKNATIFTGEIKLPAENPNTLATTAPKVAPDEIPIIPGSAKGFLKNNWNTAPEPPSIIPVNKTSKALGSLSRKNIILLKFEVAVLSDISEENKDFITEKIFSFSAPTPTANAKQKKRTIKQIIKLMQIFRFSFILKQPEQLNKVLLHFVPFLAPP